MPDISLSTLSAYATLEQIFERKGSSEPSGRAAVQCPNVQLSSGPTPSGKVSGPQESHKKAT
jgi:hypothetical protein